MKRGVTFILLIISILSVFAQKNTPMRAYNLYYDKDYVKAKECIDMCILDEKMAAKANTWLYKANIDYRLASQEYSAKQEDDSYVILHPTAPEEAYQAFKKAYSLNKNVEATEMISPSEALPLMYPLLFIQGVNYLTDHNIERSQEVLALAVESYEMKTPEYPLEGQLYYYYAYTFELQKDNASAQKYYQKAIDDGSTDMSVILRLIESYKTTGEREKVLSLIENARKNQPNNVDVMVAEAEYYYWIGDKSKGRALLDKLPASISNSNDALVNAANLYIKDECYTQAEEMLKKAYRQNPGNSVVVHNLGVCCSNIGEAKYIEANKLSLEGKQIESQNVKQSADRYMTEAAEFFEKALVNDPSDITLVQKLREIYLRLSQTEKAKEMEQRLNQMQK